MTVAGAVDSVTLYPNTAAVPEHSGLDLVGKSFGITARLVLGDGACPDGMVYSLGGRFGGHALFFQNGRPRYVYDWLGENEQRSTCAEPLQAGACTVNCGTRSNGMTAPRRTGTPNCRSTAPPWPAPRSGHNRDTSHRTARARPSAVRSISRYPPAISRRSPSPVERSTTPWSRCPVPGTDGDLESWSSESATPAR